MTCTHKPRLSVDPRGWPATTTMTVANRTYRWIQNDTAAVLPSYSLAGHRPYASIYEPIVWCDWAPAKKRRRK